MRRYIKILISQKNVQTLKKTFENQCSKIRTTRTIIIIVMVIACLPSIIATIAEPKAPNFQYFERPKYRYPYYDEKGRGRLLYGYGGSELYQYRTYSALEGIH